MVGEIKYEDLDTCKKCCHLVGNEFCRNHRDKPKFVYVHIEDSKLYVCGNYKKDDA